MKALWVGVFCAALAVGGTPASGGQLANPSFETDFGPRDNMNVWGDYGDGWGETYQVNAGKESHPRKARSGDRVLLINVPPASWNGIWQQIPWEAKKPFEWSGYYLINGGDLPQKCSTFLKVEFYDASDAQLGSLEGTHHRTGTNGQWVKDTMKGETPAGTAAIRFILVAGDNAGGSNIANRIYWDDVDTQD